MKSSLITYAWKTALGLCAAALLARCLVHLTSHHYNTSGEANGLYGVLEVADGKPLYPGKNARPYAIHLYPPLHAWTSGALLRVLGIESLRARVAIVRMLGFFALCAAVWILWRGLAVPRGIAPAAFGIALLLALPKLVDYATTARNDNLALALEIGAAALFASWVRAPRRAKLLGFAVLCLLSISTRQTGIVALGSAVLWLTARRRFALAATLGLGVGMAAALGAYGLSRMYPDAFLDQAFFANVRYAPSRFSLSLSFLSFCASYVLFFGLLVRSFVDRFRGGLKDPVDGYLILTIALGALVLGGLSFRAGGDVNYLFFPLLLGCLLCAEAARDLLARPAFRAVASAQLVAIAAIVGYKTYSASRVAYLPFARVAAELREHYEPYGILDGSLAAGMSIHLRGWAYHGPDVTNTTNLGRFAHERLRWTLGDTVLAFRGGRVHTIVVAQPGCEADITRAPELPISRSRWESFSQRTPRESWLCIHRRPADTTGKALTADATH